MTGKRLRLSSITDEDSISLSLIYSPHNFFRRKAHRSSIRFQTRELFAFYTNELEKIFHYFKYGNGSWPKKKNVKF